MFEPEQGRHQGLDKAVIKRAHRSLSRPLSKLVPTIIQSLTRTQDKDQQPLLEEEFEHCSAMSSISIGLFPVGRPLFLAEFRISDSLSL